MVRIASFLGDLFLVAEGLALLFVAVVYCYGLFLLFWGAESPENTRVGRILILMEENWRAMLLLMVPLLYPPIRRFASKMRSITARMGNYTVTMRTDVEPTPNPPQTGE